LSVRRWPYFRDSLAASNQRSRISFETGAGLDRNRFAGEHRLIKQDFAFGQSHVGSHHGSQRQLHNIAGHE